MFAQEFASAIDTLAEQAPRPSLSPRRLRVMPTALRSGPYRIYTWSHEPDEPPHMHVDRDELSAKFRLQPVALAANYGFRPVELRKIQRILEEH